MEYRDEVAGRLTRLMSMLINNQNHNQATNRSLPDCALSQQAADRMALDVWNEEVPVTDRGKVVVSKSQVACGSLATLLREHFEDAARKVLDDRSVPMWIDSLATHAVASVDYQDIARSLIDNIEEVIERVGEVA
jgi:hypothetical protein